MIRSVVVAFSLALPLAAFSEGVAEPESYREDHYRGPVPSTLQGAKVIGVDQAYDLWKTGGTAFVDVLPRAPKPEGLPEGTIWREKPRNSIPGAIWLPNVGYGQLPDITHDYFRAGLAKVTSGDTAHPVVFFCLDECWMSWNAAKRAIEEYGYENVYWFPEGTDGWEFEDHPTEEIKPAP